MQWDTKLAKMKSSRGRMEAGRGEAQVHDGLGEKSGGGGGFKKDQSDSCQARG